MINEISNETRAKGFLIGALGCAAYSMGLDMLYVNDLCAIWMASMGLIFNNLGFYLLDKGEL